VNDRLERRSTMRRLLIAALLAALLGVPLASAGVRHAARYPSSIAVLGTPTAAGWGADSAHPFRNTPEDSWATGTNPAVRSIYSRLLALNPAVKRHNANLTSGESAPEAAGHELDSFAAQVQKALQLRVKPELVLVQVIDRAIKCDGTTERNFADYGSRFGDALQTLSKGLPNARIFVVSQWGSFASYVNYLKGLDVGKRLKNAGKHPCQLVAAPSGQVVASRVAYAKSIVAGEEAQLRTACAKVVNCRYDGGAAQRIAVTAADISEFQYTPTLQGQAKVAAAEWKAMAGFVKGA
jgi:hypothetical protein